MDISASFLLMYICYLTFLIGISEGKGVRSGGNRNRARLGSSSSGSLSRSRYPSFRSSYGSNWQLAAAAGYLYGYSSFRSRPYYSRYPSRDPHICTNIYDNKMENGTTYKYFICPLEGQPDDYTSCCGPDDRERCCKIKWTTGKIIGLVFGLGIIITIIIGVCFYCKRKRFSRKREGEVLRTNDTGTMGNTVPPYSDEFKMTDYPPQATGYPPQPCYPVSGPVVYPPNNPASGPPEVYLPVNPGMPMPSGDSAPPYPTVYPPTYPVNTHYTGNPTPGYPSSPPPPYPMT